MRRPDFSEYVVHFTKDVAPEDQVAGKPIQQIRAMTAKQRLFSILTDGRLLATNMPWTNKPAVCFTECTWFSLMYHAERYSRFGVGFHKALLFAAGGGPAIYLPPGLMEHQKEHVGEEIYPFHERVFAFMTPFVPFYSPQAYKDRFWKGRPPVDFSHEREWRVPHDLVFTLRKVAFVIVDTYEDMAQAPTELKDGIGRENWLIMANHQRIEKLWPLHHLPD